MTIYSRVRIIRRKAEAESKKHNTLLDVIIALRDFNRNNQDYFTFIAKNVHSGYNRINWSKTIASSQAFYSEWNSCLR